MAKEVAQDVELQKKLQSGDMRDLSNDRGVYKQLKLKMYQAAEMQKAQIGEQRLRRLAESMM